MFKAEGDIDSLSENVETSEGNARFYFLYDDNNSLMMNMGYVGGEESFDSYKNSAKNIIDTVEIESEDGFAF